MRSVSQSTKYFFGDQNGFSKNSNALLDVLYGLPAMKRHFLYAICPTRRIRSSLRGASLLPENVKTLRSPAQVVRRVPSAQRRRRQPPKKIVDGPSRRRRLAIPTARGRIQVPVHGVEQRRPQRRQRRLVAIRQGRRELPPQIVPFSHEPPHLWQGIVRRQPRHPRQPPVARRGKVRHGLDLEKQVHGAALQVLR